MPDFDVHVNEWTARSLFGETDYRHWSEGGRGREREGDRERYGWAVES